MSEITEHVGQLIREARKKKGMTQKELGEKVGVAESTVARFENGKQNLTLETLNRLSDALSVKLVIDFQ